MDLNRREPSKYDSLRYHGFKGNTRYQRVEGVADRFEIAKQWIDGQLRLGTQMEDRASYDGLVAVCCNNYNQALIGNDRIIGRSIGRDTRKTALDEFKNDTRTLEDRALRMIQVMPEHQAAYQRISHYMTLADQHREFFENNANLYRPTIPSITTKHNFIVGWERAYNEFRAAIIPTIESGAQGNHLKILEERFRKLTAYRDRLQQNLREFRIAPEETTQAFTILPPRAQNLPLLHPEDLPQVIITEREIPEGEEER